MKSVNSNEEKIILITSYRISSVVIYMESPREGIDDNGKDCLYFEENCISPADQLLGNAISESKLSTIDFSNF